MLTKMTVRKTLSVGLIRVMPVRINDVAMPETSATMTALIPSQNAGPRLVPCGAARWGVEPDVTVAAVIAWVSSPLLSALGHGHPGRRELDCRLR